MEVVKPMNWYELKHEYQLDGKRLLPWDDWDMPFGGAWCVVRAHSDSLLHDHDEQEMFIVASGEATIHIGGRVIYAKKGDFIAIPPGNSHFVENSGETDFHFFTVWWDTETCESFLEKQRKVKEHG